MTAVAGGALLAEITAEARDWLAELGRRQSYRDGELVHSRGDPDPAMGIVIRGAIKIGRLMPSGANTFVSEIGEGQHYADVLMLGVRRRTHDAIAVGPTEIDHYDAPAFARILQRLDIVQALYTITGARLSGAMVMNDDLRSLPREVHLAKVLLHMARRADRTGAVPCLQEDLASMLGVSAMTLSKAMLRLRHLGLVEPGYRKVTIPDREGLRRWLRAQIAS